MIFYYRNSLFIGNERIIVGITSFFLVGECEILDDEDESDDKQSIFCILEKRYSTK
jgi:hypothetical protein